MRVRIWREDKQQTDVTTGGREQRNANEMWWDETRMRWDREREREGGETVKRNKAKNSFGREAKFVFWLVLLFHYASVRSMVRKFYQPQKRSTFSASTSRDYCYFLHLLQLSTYNSVSLYFNNKMIKKKCFSLTAKDCSFFITFKLLIDALCTIQLKKTERRLYFSTWHMFQTTQMLCHARLSFLLTFSAFNI